jgi:hypothetical protein
LPDTTRGTVVCSVQQTLDQSLCDGRRVRDDVVEPQVSLVFFITFRNVFSMFGIPLFGITGLAFAVLRVKPLFLVFGCIITSPAIETFTSKPICCLRGLGPKVRCQRLNFAALTASLAFAFLETPLAYVGMLLWLHVRRRLGPSALRASSSICFVPPPFMMDFLARFADSADLGKLGERLLVSAATTNFRVFP